MPELSDLPGMLDRVGTLSPDILSKFITSILSLLGLYVLRWLILRIVARGGAKPQTVYKWRKISGNTALILGLILVGRVWFAGVQSLATFLGLVGAGLAIALRDPLVNMAGWIFIVARQLFKVGDRIQLGQVAGDVIDINVFYFSILEIGNWVHADQSTGRIVQVPNSKVFGNEVANYTKGFQYIWNEMPIIITFESNWQKAKTVLQEIADKHAQHLGPSVEKEILRAARSYMIFYSHLTPTVYSSIAESGVTLTVRYICQPRQRRDTAQAISEDILREFARHRDIDFAYPTQRFYNNLAEGKITRQTK